ncbi:MAG: 50S ribosomal protein L9 [Candidatus Pacebacteria bacterium]|nr:50S ribosomal protein L9 [Candidatus Paceibacterota bacterium]
MKVILLQDISKIGKKFDIKEISDGYAVNFLLPKKLVKLATNKAIKELAGKKKKYEETRRIEREEITKKIEKIKDSPLEIKVKTNKEGKLFAGIGAKEIAEFLEKQSGLKIDPEIIKLKTPIKEIGGHKVKIKAGEEETELILNIKTE